MCCMRLAWWSCQPHFAHRYTHHNSRNYITMIQRVTYSVLTFHGYIWDVLVYYFLLVSHYLVSKWWLLIPEILYNNYSYNNPSTLYKFYAADLWSSWLLLQQWNTHLLPILWVLIKPSCTQITGYKMIREE